MRENRTVNERELHKFAKLSGDWHEPRGSFSMLHKMNRLRVKYISENSEIDKKRVLDIGCGGGILSESLAKLGANVIAIDPCGDNIEDAKIHSPGGVEYIHATLEEFSTRKELFDVICVMEVVEHVDELDYFIELCSSLLVSGGRLFFSTINRTLNSYLLAIIAAEYIFKFVPKKTHDWKKFVKPSEILFLLEKNNIIIKNLSGMRYNILTSDWNIKKNLDVNYIGHGVKR